MNFNLIKIVCTICILIITSTSFHSEPIIEKSNDVIISEQPTHYQNTIDTYLKSLNQLYPQCPNLQSNNDQFSYILIQNFIQTPDQGYLLCGYSFYSLSTVSFLIKTDNEGKELWNKTFQLKQGTIFSSCDNTPDNGYIVVGGTRDGYNETSSTVVVKTDNQGNQQWIQYYDFEQSSTGTSIFSTDDGGYIIQGVVYNSSDNMYDYVMKTDSNGMILWKKTYIDLNERIYLKMKQTPDEGYILWGLPLIWENEYVFLIKIDRNGTKEWENEYRIMNSTRALDLTLTHLGEYVITGQTRQSYSTDHFMFVLKVDTNGNEQWNKTYKYDIVCTCLDQTNDLGFIVCGYHNEEHCPYVMKFNNIGEIQWMKSYANISETFFNKIIQLNDPHYVAIGYKFEWENNQCTHLQTDNMGEIDWIYSYDVIKGDIGHVRFYGWSTHPNVNQVNIRIGNLARIGIGGFQDYYQTGSYGLCKGTYHYSITWSGIEGSNTMTDLLYVKTDESQDICFNLSFCDDLPVVEIIHPAKGIYLLDRKILPFLTSVIIGDITIQVDAYDNTSGIDYVEFYIDEQLVHENSEIPFSYHWDSFSLGKHTITIKAYDKVGYETIKQFEVWKIL